MSTILPATLAKSHLDFAIGNMTATLTAVTPTNAEVYVCNKQDVQISFEIDENGRETTIDTRFYMAIEDYSTLPTKGTILTDGTRNYKVINTHRDAIGVTYRVDCEAEHQR